MRFLIDFFIDCLLWVSVTAVIMGVCIHLITTL